MFSKWMKVIENEELLKVCKEIQENFVDDFLNFEDTSVGIYWIGKLDQYIIDEINSDCEEVVVKKWEENKMLMEVDSNYLLTIEVVIIGTGEYMEDSWEITNARKKYNFEK
jgi:hypothetical protein